MAEAETTIFKRIKKDLTQSLLDTKTELDLGFSKKADPNVVLEKSKAEMIKSEKFMKDLDIQFGILSGREKDHYKNKIAKLR